MNFVIEHAKIVYTESDIPCCICSLDDKALFVNNAFQNLYQVNLLQKYNITVVDGVLIEPASLSMFSWQVFKDYKLYKSILNEMMTAEPFSVGVGMNFNRKPENFLMLVFHELLINKYNCNQIAVMIKLLPLPNGIPFHKTIRQKNTASTLSYLNLTKTEKIEQLLFLICHFSTYEDIANILSLRYNKIITKNAIGKYVRVNIFPLYNTYNLDNLRSKLLDLNHHKIIPITLFSSFYVGLDMI